MKIATINARFPAAFDNPMPPILPSMVNKVAVRMLIDAAKAAGNSAIGTTTKLQLGERSKDSEAMLPYWQLTDDIVTGKDAIKAASTKYLPKFEDESATEYNWRLDNTKFTNVYRDIVETLASKPFEEEIKLALEKDKKAPDQINAFIEDVDGAGNNLTTFSATTFFNGINSAIDWIFVDYPKVDRTKVVTQAQAKEAGIKPFWSHVLGMNVLEAKSQVIGGNEHLIYIRIIEPGSPNHIRIFERYTDKTIWALFEEQLEADGRTKKYILVDEGEITIGIIPLVPFITGRREGRTFKFFPAMKDAADLQIELYQQESGLKFAKTMTAYSMLAANGIKPQLEADGKTPKKIAVGPSKVLYSAPDGSGNIGSWSYVSPDASCLKFLADDVKETIQQLRELGRLPLTAQSGNVTVITSAFAAGKSRSAVQRWGLSLKDALENALVITCMWLNIPTTEFDPQVDVFDEYDNYADGEGDRQTLNEARKNRDISRMTYWKELVRRGTLAPEFDPKDEIEELLKEVPSDDPEDDEETPPGNKK